MGEESFKKYRMNRMEKLRNETFSYIFQNYYLLREHTVFYNVKIALNRFGYTGQEQTQIVNEALERVGMKRYRDRLVGELSGGQQQRVAIARAIVGNPKVILADEPTGNLDSDNTEIIMQLLKELSEDKLVVVVTHDREVAEEYADRIINFKKGRIIGDRINQPKSGILLSREQSKTKTMISKKSKRSGLSIKEILEMAYGNIRMLGKRRILLAAVMLVTSIIATLGTIDYVNQNHTSYHDKITKDSHIVHIKCNWIEGLSDEDFLYFANSFYEKALMDTEYYEYAATEAKLTLQYNDFEQLSRLRFGLE
ncbi:MAG: ABC transporter ATP-binding protein [Wujia sp.]